MAERYLWRELWHGAVDLIYPAASSCAICDREAVRPWLHFCAACLRRLPFLTPPFCVRCGRLLRLSSAIGSDCQECARERLFFSRARAACLYEGAARAYLHEAKFHRALGMVKALAEVLAVYAREEAGFFRRYGAIVPVPLHTARQSERGFNQAEIMARAVGAALRRPVHLEALVRARETEAQSRLDREHRRRNVHMAFRVVDPRCMAKRRILLVDDVLTTGYTASECARAILRAGASEVGVLTLANGVIEEAWLAGREEKDRVVTVVKKD